jgi:Cu-processing system permease protein
MIRRILSTAGIEFRIALRNRWVTIAVVMMALFALVLSAAGSAPTGALGADRLSVTVASLTSLSVYLVPLIALLISFDAIAGEVERGTLPLRNWAWSRWRWCWAMRWPRSPPLSPTPRRPRACPRCGG